MPVPSDARSPLSSAVVPVTQLLAALPEAPIRSPNLPRWRSAGAITDVLSLVVRVIPTDFLIAAHRGAMTVREAAVSGRVHLAFPPTPLRAALRRAAVVVPSKMDLFPRLFGTTAFDGPAAVTVGNFASLATYATDGLPPGSVAIAGVGTVIPPGCPLLGIVSLHTPSRVELGHLVAVLQHAAREGLAPVPGHAGRARIDILGMTLGSLTPSIDALLAGLGAGQDFQAVIAAAAPGRLVATGVGLGPALEALANRPWRDAQVPPARELTLSCR